MPQLYFNPPNNDSKIQGWESCSSPDPCLSCVFVANTQPLSFPIFYFFDYLLLLFFVSFFLISSFVPLLPSPTASYLLLLPLPSSPTLLCFLLPNTLFRSSSPFYFLLSSTSSTTFFSSSSSFSSS